MRVLQGKSAIVTGAASGIGKAIAMAFMHAGSRVVLCDVNARALEAVASRLGERAIAHVTD